MSNSEKKSQGFRELDPLLHSALRLAVVSLLAGVRSAEFSFIKEKTGATAGNLSVQLGKLEKAGYVKVSKSFKNNYPCTTVSLTDKGLSAFGQYAENLKTYLTV